MARNNNAVDAVIAQEAIKQVDNLISKLSQADAELIKISESALKAGKGIASISTPSGMDKAISNTTSLNAQLQKQNDIVNKLHSDIAKKAEQSRLAEIKLQQQREKAFDSFDKNAKKEAAITEKNSNLYNKTQQQINTLTKSYNDLAVKKERYGNLTANEEMRLKTLQAVTEKYNGVLKNTDAQIGKNQRNVGNYASGYNALGNSINQLTREAPAFANSLNTGFMAISNNLPALFDAIGGIKKQLAEAKKEAMSAAVTQGLLAKEQAILGGATEEAASAIGDQAKELALSSAEGVKGKGVLKQLASSFFSISTLLSIGVTLLTIYGGKLIDMAFGATEASKAQDALNEAISDSKNTISSESAQLSSLTSIVLDHNESQTNRKLAYDEIKKTLPGLTSATYEQAISTGELTIATNLYITSLIQKNIVEAEAKSIAEDQTALNKRSALSIKERQGSFIAFMNMITFQQEAGEVLSKARYAREDKVLQKSLDERKKALIQAQEDFLKTQAKLKPFITPPEKEKKAKKVDTTPKVQQLETFLKSVSTTMGQINAEIDRLQVEKITAGWEEYPLINLQLEYFLKLRKELNGLPDGNVNIVNTTQKAAEAIKRLSEEQKNYLNSFTQDLVSNTGFTETFKMLNSEIEGFGENWKVTTVAIMESMQEMFNFINQNSESNFNAESKRLQYQKDISIKYAGENAVAKAKIEEDFNKKQAELEYRQAKAKQKQALFNIAIDTAQAIMATLGEAGFAGIPLSVIVGALGAAQLAMVATQDIPRYFDGGVHGGGLAMINDAGGSNYVETVVTPDGKAQQFKGRNVITDLPSGSEIFTPEQWRERQLSMMLNEKGISMSKNYNSSNGMTANEMDLILSKHFSKIQTNHTTFDKNGFRNWSEKNGNRTINSNNRGAGIGYKV
jgi:hypothetical protein